VDATETRIVKDTIQIKMVEYIGSFSYFLKAHGKRLFKYLP